MDNKREQEVIEAIKEILLPEWGQEFDEKPCRCQKCLGKAQKRLDALCALAYPSGHNMIVMLDDDQTFPPFLTHKGMSCEEIVQTTRQSMYDKHWRKILGGK